MSLQSFVKKEKLINEGAIDWVVKSDCSRVEGLGSKGQE